MNKSTLTFATENENESENVTAQRYENGNENGNKNGKEMKKTEERMENMTEVAVDSLSKYRIFVDSLGEPHVWSLRYGRWIPFRVPKGRRVATVTLTPDGYTKMRNVSTGLLKFIIRHPKTARTLLTAPAYSRRGAMMFNAAGEFTQVERKKSYRVFGSLDSALESILLLINIRESGSTWQLYDFADRNAHQAKYAVRRYENADYVEAAWESAKERFVRNCLEMDVERIRPLFAQLCCSLKSEAMDYRKRQIRLAKALDFPCRDACQG